MKSREICFSFPKQKVWYVHDLHLHIFFFFFLSRRVVTIDTMELLHNIERCFASCVYSLAIRKRPYLHLGLEVPPERWFFFQKTYVFLFVIHHFRFPDQFYPFSLYYVQPMFCYFASYRFVIQKLFLYMSLITSHSCILAFTYKDRIASL